MDADYLCNVKSEKVLSFVRKLNQICTANTKSTYVRSCLSLQGVGFSHLKSVGGKVTKCFWKS